jgi:hypothetical protein
MRPSHFTLRPRRLMRLVMVSLTKAVPYPSDTRPLSTFLRPLSRLRCPLCTRHLGSSQFSEQDLYHFCLSPLDLAQKLLSPKHKL